MSDDLTERLRGLTQNAASRPSGTTTITFAELAWTLRELRLRDDVLDARDARIAELTELADAVLEWDDAARAGRGDDGWMRFEQVEDRLAELAAAERARQEDTDG